MDESTRSFLRLEALKLAVSQMRENDTDKTVVEAAKKFADFLIG